MSKALLYSTELAEWYDTMYCNEAATAKQIHFLDKIFRRHKATAILDIACGTGRHAIGLKRKGYEVEGIDVSSDMIKYAQRKTKDQELSIDFTIGDMRYFRLKRKFDAAIIFFTSFAYLDTNDDVIGALENINRHLKANGILIIETFFGWPRIVADEFKPQNVRKIHKENRLYEIHDENFLDPVNNYLYTKQTHIRKVGSRNFKTITDRRPSKLRLYFPNELDLLFRISGFKTLNFFGDINGHKLSGEHNARLIAIAQKIR